MPKGDPNKRRKGEPKTDKQRASDHFDVPIEEVTPEMIENLPKRGSGIDE